MESDPMEDPWGDPFWSAWLKWSWAVAEAELLKADIAAFTEDENAERQNTLRCDYHPNRHGFALTVASLAPTPITISLRLSNVAHHFRSSLDNLAWAVVTQGRRPPHVLNSKQRRAIAYPICNDRDFFNSRLRDSSKSPSSLPGIRVADRAVIRKTQPYKRGKTNIPYHSLAVLSAFNNTDKHRALQPVLFLPKTLWYKIADHRDCSITRTPRQARRRVVEVGAELAFFPARRLGPDPYLHVKYQLTTLPAIHERLSLDSWLTETSRYIGAILVRLGGMREAARPMLEHVGIPS
jgi:hypothetical protein